MKFNIDVPKHCSDCVFSSEGGYACNLLNGKLCHMLDGQPHWCPFNIDGAKIEHEGVVCLERKKRMTIKEAVEKYNKYTAAVNKYTSLFDKIDSSMNRARVSGTDSIEITFENWADIKYAISLAISHYNHRLKENFDDKALDDADSAMRDLSRLVSCLPAISEVEKASADLHVIAQYIKFLRGEDEPQKEENE